MRFGEFTLDVTERLLLREGRPVPLTPKAFDVLAALAARPGRLVTKDELLKEVWPDSFVEESNLAYHVFAIRRALGEAAEGQKFIETVPKRGYRLVATIEADGDAGAGRDTWASSPVAEPDLQPNDVPGTPGLRTSDTLRRPEVEEYPRARRFSSRTRVWWFAGGALTTAALAFLVASGYPGAPPPASQPTRVEVSSGGVRLSWTSTFTISPNGRHLVFAGAGPDGVERLWVRSLDATDVRPLAGTEVALGGIVPPMFWSPDSRFVAFDAVGQLKKIDISGGAPQTVCALPGLAIGGSWNRDDVILVGTIGAIYRCSASGGASSIVTQLDGSRQHFAHVFPWFLPDGRRFIYLAVSREEPENSGIYVHALDALPDAALSTRVLDARFGAAYAPSAGAGPGHLLFMRDGELYAQGFDTARLQLTGGAVRIAGTVGHFLDGAFFSPSTNGTIAFRPPEAARRLTWLDREGKVLGRIGELGRYSGLALAPDDQRAVVVQHAVGANVDQDLWLVDLSSGRSSRLTFDARLEEVPVWSPDGKRIIFTASGAIGSLFEQSVHGEQGARLLLETTEHKYPESVSPDGSVLLYATAGFGATRVDLSVLPLTGEPTPRPVIHRDFDQFQAQFSPDGRWIAYVSSESGRQEVLLRPFSSAVADANTEVESRVVSTAGGLAPRWRADGKELFFVTPEGAITAVDVSTSGELQIGTPRTLFHAPDLAFLGPGSSPAWGVAADGQRFLMLLPETRTPPTAFSLILNWQTGLD